jgi:cbb3-type cytochrome oxidase subunit 1
MPRLSVWFVRSALVYLILGFTLWALILINKGIPLHPLVWRLLPSHIEFVLFGWTVQLVIGMAFWILPRFANPPVRGNERLAWATLILVNIGILMIVLASFYSAFGWLNLAGRMAEAAGVLFFALHAWPRVKKT